MARIRVHDALLVVLLPSFVLIFYVMFCGPDLSGLAWNSGVEKMKDVKEQEEIGLQRGKDVIEMQHKLVMKDGNNVGSLTNSSINNFNSSLNSNTTATTSQKPEVFVSQYSHESTASGSSSSESSTAINSSTDSPSSSSSSNQSVSPPSTSFTSSPLTLSSPSTESPSSSLAPLSSSSEPVHVVKGAGDGVLEGKGTGNGILEGKGAGDRVLEDQGTGNEVSEGKGTGNEVSEGKGTGNGVSGDQGTGNGVSEDQGAGNGVSEGKGTGNGVSEGKGTGNGVSGDQGTGNGVSGDQGTGNGVSKDQGTGNGVSKDQGTGNELSKDQGTGNELSKDLGTGNELSKDQGTGNELSKDLGTGNELSEDLGTGNGVSKDQGTGNGVSEDLGTGNELSKDQGTGNWSYAPTAALAFRRVLEKPVSTIPYSSLYKNPCWRENDYFYCLPGAFLSGFPKCGTTDLYTKLQWHPDVALHNKEIHWWTRSRFMGRTTLFYKSLFWTAARRVRRHPDTIAIDASPSTIWDNGKIFGPLGDATVPDPEHLIPYYIHRQIPGAKSIVIMRHPVKRLYSDFLFFGRFAKRSAEAFHRVTVEAVDRFNACLGSFSTQHCVYAQVSTEDLLGRLRIGLYYFHIKNWLDVFPSHQLHWVRLEDYSKDPAKVLTGIFDFLGVQEIPSSDIEAYVTSSKVENAKPKMYVNHGDMLPQTKKLLYDFYRPYNIKLAELLNDRRLLYAE